MGDDLTSGGTVLPITRWGTPVMHERTRTVDVFDDELRSLVRAARKDAAAAPEQRSGRAFRELFRYIRQHDGAPSAAADAAGDRDV